MASRVKAIVAVNDLALEIDPIDVVGGIGPLVGSVTRKSATRVKEAGIATIVETEIGIATGKD